MQNKDYTFKNYIYDYSVLSLLVTNIIVIIIALTKNWNALTLIWIYWFQSLIIGFFTFIKILRKKEQLNKIPMALFFVFHYGFFHFVYFTFLSFADIFSSRINISIVSILITSGMFFVNHLFSFLYNKDKDKNMKINDLMFSAYKRILPIHFIILLAGFISIPLIFLDSLFNGIADNMIIFIFLVLKTIVDVIFHIKVHKVSNR